MAVDLFIFIRMLIFFMQIFVVPQKHFSTPHKNNSQCVHWGSIIFVQLGGCFQPTNFFPFSLKHANFCVFVNLEPSSVPNVIVLFNLLGYFILILTICSNLLDSTILSLILESVNVVPSLLSIQFHRRWSIWLLGQLQQDVGIPPAPASAGQIAGCS